MRDVRASMVLLICVALAGCVQDAATSQTPRAEPATAAPPAARSQQAFDGYIFPTNATKLRAPQNTFRIGGWNSSSSWIKLQMLAEDGKKVSEGDVIGGFEFQGKRALDQVQNSLRNAQANKERSQLDVGDQLAQMSVARRKLELDAERARLDTTRGSVVAARDLERFQIDHKLAEFEAQAQGKQIKAYRRSVKAESAYHTQNVARAESDVNRYNVYEERFKVRAPHDGVVRHAFFKRRRRKVQQGDGMPSGMHFVSLARDEELSIQFYIPEERYALTKTQKKFEVKSPKSNETFPIEVTRVDEFPQELGFLKQDDALPNAREKMYVVHARFVEQPEGLSAGLEVEVVMP